MNVKAVLRTAYSNQQSIFDSFMAVPTAGSTAQIDISSTSPKQKFTILNGA
jgi:hypothetical protein